MGGRMLRNVVLAALLAGGMGFAEADDTTAPVVEQYRMNLGGPSGQYTDWARSGIVGFAGLTATIEIQKTHGRPRDKWAALARVNLRGPENAAGEAAFVSVVLEANRRSGEILAVFRPGATSEPVRLDFTGAVGRPIELSMHVQPDQQFELRLGESRFTMTLPADFHVESVDAVGSGVDVRFEPFTILRH